MLRSIVISLISELYILKNDQQSYSILGGNSQIEKADKR